MHVFVKTRSFNFHVTNCIKLSPAVQHTAPQTTTVQLRIVSLMPEKEHVYAF